MKNRLSTPQGGDEGVGVEAPVVPRGSNVARKILHLILAFLILLIIAVGCFAAYAWLSASEAPMQSIADPKPKTQLEERAAPGAIDPKAPVGVAVQSITSPTTPGSNVLLIVKTRPLANCTITVEYNKVKSTDSGLFEKTADDYGVVQWSWAVEQAAPLGKWPVTVTCTYNEKAGMVVADLELKSSTED